MIKIESPPVIKKPKWLKVKLHTGENYKDMKFLMKEIQLSEFIFPSYNIKYDKWGW